MIQQIAAGFVRLLTGCRASSELEPGSCPRVYIANHSSHLDALVIWASLPSSERNRAAIVAAEDYWTAGPVRRLIAKRVLRTILINRKRITKENNPMRPICAALRAGQVLILFPEGSRCADGTIGAFHSGIYHIASEIPQTVFVPVYLENMNRILPKGEILAVPIIGSVRFGPPLRLRPTEPRQDFLQRAREAVLTLAEIHQ